MQPDLSLNVNPRGKMHRRWLLRHRRERRADLLQPFPRRLVGGEICGESREGCREGEEFGRMHMAIEAKVSPAPRLRLWISNSWFFGEAYTLNEEEVAANVTGFTHNVFLGNLKPATRYYLTAVADGKASQEYYFVTAPNDDREIRLLAVGDNRVGSARTHPDNMRRRVNALMGRLLEKHPRNRKRCRVFRSYRRNNSAGGVRGLESGPLPLPRPILKACPREVAQRPARPRQARSTIWARLRGVRATRPVSNSFFHESGD
jgi:hypothetical protein